MNQGSLEGAIDALRVLANNCETSRDNIVRYYNDDGNTLEEAGYREPDDFYSAASSAIQTLRDRATTIETYKDKIVELNESGVASMDADGVITLTLPDSFTFPEDPKNFASCAQAAIDAYDLKILGERKNDNKGGGELPSGRTYDGLIASIEANKTDATYADSLIVDIGPENLTSLPLDVDRAFMVDSLKANTAQTQRLGTILRYFLGTSWRQRRAHGLLVVPRRLPKPSKNRSTKRVSTAELLCSTPCSEAMITMAIMSPTWSTAPTFLWS
jgi:hypothetical protein